MCGADDKKTAYPEDISYILWFKFKQGIIIEVALMVFYKKYAGNHFVFFPQATSPSPMTDY